MIYPENTILTKPQMVLDLNKVKKNILKVFGKFHEQGVFFRPHFKTHQCPAIGEIFKSLGVTAITVSSLDMAAYFARHGWQDITLAVPVNPGQIKKISELAATIRLNLLVDSAETVEMLNDTLESECPIWIKVDVGYGRVGVKWHNREGLLRLVELIENSEKLDFSGLLTHSGHTYDCHGSREVIDLFNEGRGRMLCLQQMLLDNGIQGKISMGDTPSASLVEDFNGVDEMRPGNFVFYDLVQSEVGSCSVEEIAVANACPVIGVYEDELKVVVYGGAAHLSKDSLNIGGERIFGQLALASDEGWRVIPLREGKVISCCQEVSKIKVSREIFDKIKIGQTLYILPVHSCLAADIYPHYVTTDGVKLERFQLYA